MLKGTILSSYRSSKTGKKVYVYAVTGTPAEMAAYKEAKGQYWRQDPETGNILHWYTPFAGTGVQPSVKLTITRNGNVVIDDLQDTLSNEAKINELVNSERAKIRAAILEGTVSTVAAPRVNAPAVPQASPAQVAPEGAETAEELLETEPATNLANAGANPGEEQLGQ